jgi:hypothetical protein
MSILQWTDAEPVEIEDLPAYARAISKKREQIKKSLEELSRLEKKVPYFSEPFPIKDIRISGKPIGVYKIFHEKDMNIMSIGQGNIKGRLIRHLGVFRNKGQDIRHEGGSTSSSITAQKMYKYDSDLNNWYFSWCDVKEKGLASEFESELQHQYRPPFNALHMGGNN